MKAKKEMQETCSYVGKGRKEERMRGRKGEEVRGDKREKE